MDTGERFLTLGGRGRMGVDKESILGTEWADSDRGGAGAPGPIPGRYPGAGGGPCADGSNRNIRTEIMGCVF